MVNRGLNRDCVTGALDRDYNYGLVRVSDTATGGRLIAKYLVMECSWVYGIAF